jgi:hypothetical protein
VKFGVNLKDKEIHDLQLHLLLNHFRTKLCVYSFVIGYIFFFT